jgi:DNA-binding response OmpR family regulator
VKPRPKRIVIVDDSDTACAMFRDILTERYGAGVAVETYVTPLNALSRIDGSIDLLIVDLEMPHMDGKKFLEFAIERGVSRSRVIVTSGRDADELHSIFPPGACLAVMNKTEPKQREAFTMILDSIMKR